MGNQPPDRFWYSLTYYATCYVLWFGLSALGLWTILQLRINLLDLVVLFELGPWIMGVADKFGTLILGLLWLIGVFLAENYLREGVEKRRLRVRTLRIFLIMSIPLAFSYGLQHLLLTQWTH